MNRRYLVKIENTILPESYSFDQLIDKGLLDNIDENIKVKLEGDSVWITARNYPFSDVENVEDNISDTTNSRQCTSPHSISHFGGQQRISDTQCTHLNERSKNFHNQSSYQREIHPQPTSPSILDTWNWGAFTLSWIWGICNGIYWPLCMIVCNFIPYFGVLCSLSICVYLGFKGNKMAWTNARQKGITVYSFERTQATWNILGLILFIISVLLAVIYVLYIIF